MSVAASHAEPWQAAAHRLTRDAPERWAAAPARVVYRDVDGSRGLRGPPGASGGFGRRTEIDVLRLDRPGRPARGGLVFPVEVRVRDHLVGRRRAPFALVFRGVRVADERRVVAAHERAVEGGTDACVGLRADDEQPADTEVCEHALEGGVLE